MGNYDARLAGVGRVIADSCSETLVVLLILPCSLWSQRCAMGHTPVATAKVIALHFLNPQTKVGF